MNLGGSLLTSDVSNYEPGNSSITQAIITTSTKTAASYHFNNINKPGNNNVTPDN